MECAADRDEGPGEMRKGRFPDTKCARRRSCGLELITQDISAPWQGISQGWSWL